MDRTREFHEWVERFSKSSSASLPPKEPTISPTLESSAFSSKADNIIKLVTDANKQIDELKNISKVTGPFDNSDYQVNNLTSFINQNIQQINEEIDGIEHLNFKKMNNSSQCHCNEVIKYVKQKTSDLVGKEKAIIQSRADNLRYQTERRSHFLGDIEFNPKNKKTRNLLGAERIFGEEGKVSSASGVPNSYSVAGDSLGGMGFVRKGPNRPESNKAQVEDDYFGDSEDVLGVNNTQLAPLEQERMQYQRNGALETISRSISQLGEMFSDMGRLLSTQREDITLIDHNMDITIDNMDGAIVELDKAKKKFSSHRGLILKILLVIVLFLIIIGIFVR